MARYKYYVSPADEGTEIEATGYRDRGQWIVFYEGPAAKDFKEVDDPKETELLRLKSAKLFKVELVRSGDR